MDPAASTGRTHVKPDPIFLRLGPEKIPSNENIAHTRSAKVACLSVLYHFPANRAGGLALCRNLPTLHTTHFFQT
jgi:hypothetical protein